MNIEIQRELFLQSFSIVGSVVPSRTPKPVLENVRIEAVPGRVVMFAVNNEIGIRLEAEGVTVKTPGIALLPVARVLPLLRESTEETLGIEVDRDRILITGRQTRVKLQARDPEEFPPVADFNETSFYSIKSSVFRRMVHRTVFATDAESSRFALGGVLLEYADGQLIAVATDGRRLARMQGAAEVVGKVASETMTIVPTLAVSLLEKCLPDDDSQVEVAPRGNDILVRNGRTVLYSRLVEGRFPRWRDVFPGHRPEAVTVQLPVDATMSAVRLAIVVADAESRGLDFEFEDGTLKLNLACANIGESHIELPVAYDGPKLAITLDYRFFTDFLRVLDSSSTFSMEIESSEKAALCSTDDGYGYVIMPLSRDRR